MKKSCLSKIVCYNIMKNYFVRELLVNSDETKFQKPLSPND